MVRPIGATNSEITWHRDSGRMPDYIRKTPPLYVAMGDWLMPETRRERSAVWTQTTRRPVVLRV